jgi:hypothetical protein
MKRRLIALTAMAMTCTGELQAAPVSQDDFRAATTANLVSLCSTPPSDPLYTAAINFCEGFAVGTYRMLEIEEAASRARRKMFCVPASVPNRDQAIAAFVKWASSRESTLAKSPTDGIAEYLAATYPCK